MRHLLGRTLAVALCTALVSTTVVAQDTEDRRDKPRQESRQNRDDNQEHQRDAHSGQQSKQVTDRLIQKLDQEVDLRDDQKKKIREIVTGNRQDYLATWQEFEQAHARAVHLEAMMIAALADGMDDQQREQFHQKRQERWKHDSAASTHGSEDHDAHHQKERQQDRGESASERNRTSPEAAHAEQKGETRERNQRREGQRDAESQQNSRDGERDSHRDQDQAQSSSDDAEGYVWTMIIVPTQQQYSATKMDNQQRAVCDEVCRAYHKQLSSAWRDVQRLHRNLVAMEAVKLEAIEQALDEEQLQKLRKSRKSADEDLRS